MARQYPRIGNRRSDTPKGNCVLCGKPKADYRVDVEFNWFRGDDEVYKVHKLCQKNMKGDDLLKRLLKKE